MFERNLSRGLKKIHWQALRPGMIYVGGIYINDTVPLELQNFPIITEDLLSLLNERYQLRSEREIFVLDPAAFPEFSQYEIPRLLTRYQRQIKDLNRFRFSYFSEKKLYLPVGSRIIDSNFLRRDYLVFDHYNSFIMPLVKNEEVPSFLQSADISLTLADLLSGKLFEKLNLPRDEEIQLHLVLDYSYSMLNCNKHEAVVKAANYFCRHLAEFLLNTKIKVYVFSKDCRVVNWPLSGKEIPREETNYASFFKMVAKNLKKNIRNKLILLTDGLPSDFPEALRIAEKLKSEKLDYTQIILTFKDELKKGVLGENLKVIDGFVADDEQEGSYLVYEHTDEEIKKMEDEAFGRFSLLAEVCGGNQIIILVNELAGLLAVECYDRYLGLLTLSLKADQRTTLDEKPKIDKQIKKYNFKKLGPELN